MSDNLEKDMSELINIISYGPDGTVLVNKSYLSSALMIFANDLHTCGDDDFQDRYFNDYIPKKIKFEITEDTKTVQIDLVTDTSEISVTTSTWDALYFFILREYFKQLNVTFSYAYLDCKTDIMTLYFKSDPESFKAFTKGIILDDMRLELDPKCQEQQANDEGIEHDF